MSDKATAKKVHNMLVFMRWAPYWFFKNRIKKPLRRVFHGHQIKIREESSFWLSVHDEIVKGCSTPEERLNAHVKNCYEDSFERYKPFLNVEADSFVGMKVVDVGCGPTCGLIGFKDCEKYGVDH